MLGVNECQELLLTKLEAQHTCPHQLVADLLYQQACLCSWGKDSSPSHRGVAATSVVGGVVTSVAVGARNWHQAGLGLCRKVHMVASSGKTLNEPSTTMFAKVRVTGMSPTYSLTLHAKCGH